MDLLESIFAVNSIALFAGLLFERSIAMAGTVKHILLLKFKDSVTPEQESELISKYAALPNSISAMKGFEWSVRSISPFLFLSVSVHASTVSGVVAILRLFFISDCPSSALGY